MTGTLAVPSTSISGRASEETAGQSFVRLDRKEIKRILPHRNEKLLLDEIEIKEATEQADGSFYVGGPNAHVFTDHFPGHPVMMGNLILEFACQTCAVLGLYLLRGHSIPEGEKRRNVRLIGYSGNIRFKKEALPGDELICIANLRRKQKSFIFFNASVFKKNEARDMVVCIPELVGISHVA